jgi:hypothetical protein
MRQRPLPAWCINHEQRWMHLIREDLGNHARPAPRWSHFTAVLITHDLRESIFRAIVSLFCLTNAHPHVMDVDLPDDRTFDVLFTPKPQICRNILRDQIKIAQGRFGGNDVFSKIATAHHRRVIFLTMEFGLGDWPNHKMVSF